MNWISVKDRLPAEGQRVLIYCPEVIHMAVVAYFERYGFLHDLDTDHITHWMPLPEPPEVV